MNVDAILNARDLPLALAVAVAVNLLVLSIVALAKILRERREAYAARVRDELTERLIPLLENGTGTVRLPPARSAAGRTSLDAVIGLISMLKGQARAVLVRLLEQQGYVDALLHEMHARDWLRRARAAAMLGGCASPRAVGTLRECVTGDESAEVRIVAAEALGNIGDAPSVHLLLEAARDPTRYQELRLADVLARMGAIAVPALEAALSDQSPRFVALVLDILIDIGTIDDSERVAALLQHRSPEIRSRAAALLGRACILEKTNSLIFASRDPVWFVRLRIVKALGDLGAPDREPERTRYFDALTHLLYDDVWHVRRNAAAVLASGGEQGLAILHNIGSDVARSALAVREVYKGRDVATVL